MALLSTAVRPGQRLALRPDRGDKRFDGIGIVNGGGATSVLLKDYPESQRSQILDLVFKPKFGASVSALLVEIPGDGNSTQGSMPSHMHARDDLDYTRGYTWWILSEAKKRNPNLTLDGTAWSAPGWIGSGEGANGRVPGGLGDAAFWSQDTADYYVAWLRGLREVYGLEFDAIGCRNEKDYSIPFAKLLRRALDASGFERVKLHAFDHWPDHKFDFVREMLADPEAQAAIDIIGAHGLNSYDPKCMPASSEVREMAERMGKPIWNTEAHVYKKGFDCTLGIVRAFNDNHIHSSATKIVNWYDIAGVYPIEPFPEDPAMILAHWPWSGHYRVREALWGYAHYGQFTEIGWRYLASGCVKLHGGGTVVSMRSGDSSEYSVIIETAGATETQFLHFDVSDELCRSPLCVWKSDRNEQFVQQESIVQKNGSWSLAIEPNAVYSVSTTTGQQKGGFGDVPAPAPFPFPYREAFTGYADPSRHGHLPRYFADVAGAFELVPRPTGDGTCLRQVVPVPTISWAPDWHPYTIIGDEKWADVEVSADVYLDCGDVAAVMGRVNHVGTGYGFVPKCYYVCVDADGVVRLVVVCGKRNKSQLVGDAEQQAIILSASDLSEGGERVLAESTAAGVGAGRWRNLKLRCAGTQITGYVDGVQVVSAVDGRHSSGMAGLLAMGFSDRLSRPYFADVIVKAIDAPDPVPSRERPGQTPIYAASRVGPVRRNA